MSTTEIRERLHHFIDRIDEPFLKAVHAMVAEYTKEKAMLSDAEKKAVDEGLSSIEKGKVFNHDEVMTKMKDKYPDMIK